MNSFDSDLSLKEFQMASRIHPESGVILTFTFIKIKVRVSVCSTSTTV